MLSALLGRKVGMTQIFGPRGGAIPVTVIEAGPCFVTQVKSAVNDGYEAVQLGFGRAKLKNTTRPILGHLGHKLSLTPNQRRRQQQEAAKNRQKARERAAGAATETEADQAESEGRTGRARARRRATGQELGPFAILREVQVHGGDIPAVGDKVDVGIFAVGERVDLIGTSKGKGFAGVMKRHGFHGGQRTHGQSDRERGQRSRHHQGAGDHSGRSRTQFAGRQRLCPRPKRRRGDDSQGLRPARVRRAQCRHRRV